VASIQDIRKSYEGYDTQYLIDMKKEYEAAELTGDTYAAISEILIEREQNKLIEKPQPSEPDPQPLNSEMRQDKLQMDDEITGDTIWRWGKPLGALVLFYVAIFVYSIIRGSGPEYSSVAESKMHNIPTLIPVDEQEISNVTGSLIYFRGSIGLVDSKRRGGPLFTSAPDKVVDYSFAEDEEIINAFIIFENIATKDRGSFTLCGGYICTLDEVFNKITRLDLPFAIFIGRTLRAVLETPVILIAGYFGQSSSVTTRLVVDNATDFEKIVVVGDETSVRFPPKSNASLVFVSQATRISVRDASTGEVENFLYKPPESTSDGNVLVLNIGSANSYYIRYATYLKQ